MLSVRLWFFRSFIQCEELDMSLRKVRWYAGAAIAFLMGFPMAEKAMADSAVDIVASSLSLAFAIASVAGDS